LDASAAAVPTIPEALQHLSRFEVERRLGEGAMGAVYLAREKETGARCALKTLLGVDPQALFRLKSEFRSIADLAHPNLVGLRELVCEDDLWFLTMDYVDGEELISHVRPRGVDGFDPDRLRAAFRQLARGLHALHQAGRIHRDLKPSNVMVDREGRVVILDFGLTLELRTGAERGVVGTPEYMAPEQAGRETGRPADWYAFGILLYEALTGAVPFVGEVLEILVQKHRTRPTRPAERNPETPKDLQDLCLALLAVRPEARPVGSDVLRRLGEATAPSLAPAGDDALFVGRQTELERLHIACVAAQKAGRIVVVVGEAGVGKSALVRRFLDAERTRDPELLVLSGRCYERETAPFKAFDGLIDDLSRHLLDREPERLASAFQDLDVAPLLRLFPVLGRVAALRERAARAVRQPTGQELRSRAFAALRELLARLTQGRTMALFVDDLHWADADSRTLLAEVMPAQDPPKLLFLATARPGRDDAAPEHTEQIHLGTLAGDEARTLASELLGDGANAQRVVAEAGGHPLFVCELARYLKEAGPDAVSAPRLEDALRVRIARLGTAAREVLDAVATAGIPTPQARLREAAGHDAETWRRAVSVLRAARLVRTQGVHAESLIEAYHDRIRETCYDSLADDRRRALHGEIASALEADGETADPAEILRHLDAAGETGRAARYAVQAARHAEAALAFDRAAELYAAALGAEHPPETARALRAARAQALANAGRGAEAAEDFLAAAAHATRERRLTWRRRAAAELLKSGHIERGTETMREVLAQIGVRLPKTPRRALVSLLWHRFRLALSGLDWTAVPEADADPALLQRLDIFQAIAVGLGHVDQVRAADFQARGLRLTLRVGEPHRVARALALEAIFLALEGRPGQAKTKDVLDAAREAAEVADDAYSRAWAISAQGCAAYYVDADLPSTVRHLREAAHVFSDFARGASWELSNARVIRLKALRRLGELHTVRRGVAELLRDADRRGDRFTATTIVRSFCVAWLAADDAPGARAELERRTWYEDDGALHLQHWYELSSHGELELYTGVQPDALSRFGPRFRRLRWSLLHRIQIVRTEAWSLWGRLAVGVAARQSPGPARRCAWAVARRAVRRLEREKLGYARPWRRLLAAALAHQAGDDAGARGLLASAKHAAAALGMRVAVKVAELRLAELNADKEAAAAAADALHVLGADNPARMADLVAPGFSGAPR